MPLRLTGHPPPRHGAARPKKKWLRRRKQVGPGSRKTAGPRRRKHNSLLPIPKRTSASVRRSSGRSSFSRIRRRPSPLRNRCSNCFHFSISAGPHRHHLPSHGPPAPRRRSRCISMAQRGISAAPGIDRCARRRQSMDYLTGQKWARETPRAFARKRSRFCVSGRRPLCGRSVTDGHVGRIPTQPKIQ
jgi:hypothetical protein